MGKKWIHRLKKEDFAHVAQRLNVALEGRLEDMRRALSEYYSHRRESSQDKKTTALTPRPSQSDYAKVAKLVREWSFRFDGAEKPFEFLEQVEWSTNTYGLDLDMIPRAMPELLKGRALKPRQSS